MLPNHQLIMNSIENGRMLPAIARATIARELAVPHSLWVDAGWLHEPAACYVTLKQKGDLRGSVGSLRAERPLIEDLKANSLAAAFADPRFKPLSAHELDSTRIEVALLSSIEPILFDDEQHARAQMRPGADGIVFEYGFHRSAVLPHAWENFPHPIDFLVHLKRRAGLPPDFWNAQVKLTRYQVSNWTE
jgi:AmmeMemoRadiSam system protein A